MKGLIRKDLYDLIAPNVVSGDLAIEFDLTIQCINQIVAVAIDSGSFNESNIRLLFNQGTIVGKRKTFLYHSQIHPNWYTRHEPKLKVDGEITILPSVKIKNLYSSIKIYPKYYLLAYARDIQSGYTEGHPDNPIIG